jgi:hypothetical protein
MELIQTFIQCDLKNLMSNVFLFVLSLSLSLFSLLVFNCLTFYFVMVTLFYFLFSNGRHGCTEMWLLICALCLSPDDRVMNMEQLYDEDDKVFR